MMCTQRRLRSAWASAQSDQSSLAAWRKAWVLSYPMNALPELWSDWSVSLLGAHVILLVLFCCGSIKKYYKMEHLFGTGMVYPYIRHQLIFVFKKGRKGGITQMPPPFNGLELFLFVWEDGWIMQFLWKWALLNPHFQTGTCNLKILDLALALNEPHRQKTCLWWFGPGKTQIGLLSYRG